MPAEVELIAGAEREELLKVKVLLKSEDGVTVMKEDGAKVGKEDGGALVGGVKVGKLLGKSVGKLVGSGSASVGAGLVDSGLLGSAVGAGPDDG